MPARLLVAPDSFKGMFRASEVAAAVARGVERAGLEPPDLCPVSGGGAGTAEALLLALGGSTAGAEVRDPAGRPVKVGFALIEDGGTAVVEVVAPSDADAPSTYGAGELVASAIDEGAQVVLLAAGRPARTDAGAGAIAALTERGGLRGAALVVLCDVPRGQRLTDAAGGMAGALAAEFGAKLEPGVPFVLDALDFDARMREAGAVIVGEGRMDATTLEGRIAGEIAVRARQAGVPCHAVCAENALSPFDQRILDIQRIVEAPTLNDLEAAGEFLATHL